MKLTNKHNFPKHLADWLENDDYDYNNDPYTISATSLLKPARIRILGQRHHEEVEQDITDLIASRVGNAIHDSIEKIDTPGYEKEVRVSRKIEVNGIEYTVSGKYDILQLNEDGSVTLRDIKTTSTWAYILGGKDDDYRNQMSIYKWILSGPHFTREKVDGEAVDVAREAKEVTDCGYIDFFFTDWQSSRAKRERDYPQLRINPNYEVPLLDPALTEAKIKRKLEVLQQYQDVPDDQLPRCTKDDLWAGEDKWAVYKAGNKRATKVCDSLKEAQEYQANRKIDGYIEHRKGTVKRCLYCPGLHFCNQAKELIKSGQLEL